MKIAIASSGLGHVSRGIETWADDLATALHRQGADVGLFKGGGPALRPFEQVLPCARRDRRPARWASALLRRGGWRWGLGSPYGVEQFTFGRNLVPRLRREQFDLVHVQDPLLARHLETTRRRGAHPAKVILAHGTEEPLEFLRHFEHVQELAPYYLERDRQLDPHATRWYAIPNFVDVERFSPAAPPLPRAELGVPQSAFLILAVSALKRTHKRVDYVIEEVARLRERHPERPVHLVVAGGRESETDDVLRFGRQRLGKAITFLENFDRARMPSLYRAADVLAHGSLVEMMPIALLEASASGLPMVAHQWPVIEWIIGDGGTSVDAREPYGLANALETYRDPNHRRQKSLRARQRAVELFSAEVVVAQILTMYRQVLGRT